ncbi:MAG: hypothetical protein GF329_10825, partial [Candidatus Lokiarchaeota archaeon]|nr:hypothetical protein [Candidatus Lokiarchaeota archaeon]
MKYTAIIFFFIISTFSITTKCTGNESTNNYSKLAFLVSGQTGSTLLNNSTVSFKSFKMGSEIFFSRNKSIQMNIYVSSINNNNIDCNVFEKGFNSYKADLSVNYFITRNFEQIISIKTGFGWEWAYFDNKNNYNLKGFSVLLCPST